MLSKNNFQKNQKHGSEGMGGRRELVGVVACFVEIVGTGVYNDT
jgi:hypothetical protein